MGSSPIFRIIKLKRVKPYGLALFDFRSGSGPCPHGSKVSAPLRSLQNRRPPDVLQPIFRKASVVAGQAPMVQGLASGSVGSWHEVPQTSLGLRSASVVAEQTSPGRLAVSAPLRSAQSRHPPDVLRPHLPQGSGCCGAGSL